MRKLLFGLMVCVSGQAYGESGCFRSVGEAARQVGVRDEGGFRVEGVRRDAFSGVEWARVVRCGRPELPGVLVREVAAAVTRTEVAAEAAGRPLVVAGDAVTVVWEQGAARGELAGVAVASGAAGARIRVRVEGLAKPAEERYVAGIVLAAGVVGLEVGR